ncbi:MAG TPA: PQQ-binding-like beta-propeller repeat protein [Rhizomicrobium sp.]|nr:PQQ-binding-like beta-propeller repeat protein [Rhizomicrobium sp.]
MNLRSSFLMVACAAALAGQAFAQDVSASHDTGKPAPLPATILARPITADVTVTDAMLLGADKDRGNWLLHGRTYDNQRFSPLTQINSASVKGLVPVAIVQTGVTNSFEVSPIIVNGVMYIATPGDHVQAYDAATGEPLWVYNPTLAYSELCCGPESRGVAVAYGKVFLAQLDGQMVALDARTGQLVWKSDAKTTLPEPAHWYSFTGAPQVYDGMVVIGSAGAEYPIRGFVQAYDAATGKLIWRFNTIPAPGEPGGDSWSEDSWKFGGGSVWNTPAFDPERGLISFGVGNPNPDILGDIRKGDNAYTDSIVALHAKDGKLAWWYQTVAHDVWDLDNAGPVIFLDAADGSGKRVPAAAESGKEGKLFIVNRETGKLLRSSASYVLESANKWTPLSQSVGAPHYPSASGGGEWSPSSFSPLTRDIYVMGSNVAWTYATKPVDRNNPALAQYIGGDMRVMLDDKAAAASTIRPSGTLTAINVDDAKFAWQYHSDYPMVGGTLATAGNLVFAGEMNGYFNAFDAKTGRKLWRFSLGAGVNAPPVTYQVGGVQYVAVAAGGNGANSNNELAAMRGHPSFGDVLAIFALPGKPH